MYSWSVNCVSCTVIIYLVCCFSTSTNHETRLLGFFRVICVCVRVSEWLCAFACECVINKPILIIPSSYFQPVVVNKDGRTPLKLAVHNGKLEVVNYLITERNIEPAGKYQ